MKRWSVTLSAEDKKRIRDDVDRRFRIRSDVRLAKKALQIAGTAAEKWRLSTLVGYYLEKYEEYTKMPIQPWGCDTRTISQSIGVLLERMDPKIAKLAIDVVFGDDMRWVKGDRSRFLSEKRLFSTHVAPLLLEALKWVKLPRDEEEGSEEVKL